MKKSSVEKRKNRLLWPLVISVGLMTAVFFFGPEFSKTFGNVNAEVSREAVTESVIGSKSADSNEVISGGKIAAMPKEASEETDAGHFLYAPSMIKKIDGKYFICDSRNHRIIYSDKLNTDFEDWETLTDASYTFGHTIDGDGELLVFDNTDSDQVFSYVKNEEGGFDHQLTLGMLEGKPHYTKYNETTGQFLVLSSEEACVYVFCNRNGELSYLRTEKLYELTGASARSISLIGDCIYIPSSNGYIFSYDCDEDCMDLRGVYALPEEFYGINQIVKIGRYFYFTVNSDDGTDENAGIYRVESLSDIINGAAEKVSDGFGFTGEPYYITAFDGRFWVCEESIDGGNGIKSFQVDEEGNIGDIKTFWHSDVVEESCKKQFASKYRIEENTEEAETVDLVIFAGQSNMSGKGEAKDAPEVKKGYEFRAISDPDGLYNIIEPFGINECTPDGANDFFLNQMVLRKRGSLVSSFANTYYEMTGVPIVAVSCSEGASKVSDWMHGGSNHDDLMNRYELAKAYLDQSEGFKVRYVYMVWCQGESDGDAGVTGAEYYERLKSFSGEFLDQGLVDAFMVIQTGTYGENWDKYNEIREAQKKLCLENDKCIMLSEIARFFYESGKMSDNYHYTQEGYNELGKNAGFAAARYSMKREEANE